MAQRKNKRSLWLIAGILAAVMLLLVGAGFWKSDNMLYSEAEKALKERALLSARDIARSLQAHKYVLKYIADSSEIRSMNWNIQRAYLLGQKEHLYFDSLFFVSKDGIGYYPEPNEVKDQSSEEFYQHMTARGEFITEPFIKEEERRSIATVVVSAKDTGGNTIGYLCGTIDLATLNKMVQDISIGETGYAFIINKDGEFVAHKNMDLVLNKESIKSYNEASAKELLTAVEARKTGFMSVGLGGEDICLSYAPVDGTDWSIAFIQSKKEALGSNFKALW